MTIRLGIQVTLQWSNLKKFLKSVGSLCVQEAQARNFDHPHLPHRHIVEGGNHHKLSFCRIFRSNTSSVDFFEIEGKAASRNMRGLEGRRLPCGTEVRLRQRGAGTPPPPSPSSLLLLLPLRLPLRPVLVPCTVALLGVTHSHAHCVFLVLFSWIDPSCVFLCIFNSSS